MFQSYFTDYTRSKGIFYGITLSFVFVILIVGLLEPWLTPEECQKRDETSQLSFDNALYKYNPCQFQRQSYLLFLTPEECSFARRLISSVVLGGVIGWERRQADRPAGIRTMALVSLGSALFTINSAYAFVSGPMAWDASRISAAIPSGVGFLGAGLIFKEAEKNELTGGVTHVVHGLTTSASLWLSAAVGVACGGALYSAATMSVAIMLTLLRFGPRSEDATFDPDTDIPLDENDDAEDDGHNNDDHDKKGEATPLLPTSPGFCTATGQPPPAMDERSDTSSAAWKSRRFATSLRHRPQLGGVM